MNKFILALVILQCSHNLLCAQNVGIGTTSPNASAQLDVTASDKGLLVPRVSLTDVATAAPVSTPATGLLVFNTNASITGGNGTGFYFWNGAQWTKLSTGVSAGGSGWQLTGNAGTNATTDFIGTTDNSNLIFKQNNQLAGFLSQTNCAWGVASLSSLTTGVNNTSIGRYSLNANTAGSFNTAIGDGALFSNTSGPYNTAIGTNTLGFNTTGKANIAVGYDALFFNAGDSNIAVGLQSMQNNGSGYGNTAVGNWTLNFNNSGIHNTAVGLSAMKNNSIGSNNVAVGHWALLKNVSGSFNIAIGESALENSLNNYNTAIGWRAMRFNTSGGYNAAFGEVALAFNTSGVFNTAIGSNALQLNTTADYNTAVGGNTLSFNTTGERNTASGYGALYKNTTGIYNVANGYTAMGENLIGEKNTAIGYSALSGNINGSRNIAIGFNASTLNTGGNNIVIGAEANVPTPSASNQVQIGNVDVTYAGVKVAWTITSDSRWKTNIQPTQLGLAFINQLKPVSYYRTNDAAQKTEYGFIAQEVEQTLIAFGDANNGVISKDYNGMLGMRYNDLFSPMVKAIQEQQAIIVGLQQQVNATTIEMHTQMTKQEALLDAQQKMIVELKGQQAAQAAEMAALKVLMQKNTK